MKKFITMIILVAGLFSACHEKQEPICPMVDAELVPMAVKDSLFVHYPDAVVETWFKVDTLGFCAKFPAAPNTIYAHFSTTGTFLETETVDANGKEVDTDNLEDNDHHGDHHHDENTCECH